MGRSRREISRIIERDENVEVRRRERKR